MDLSEAEAELYDRQIRLWGLDSQKRLRAAKILLIGLKGFGAEIAKNIILSGVKSVTLLDNQSLTEEDTHAQFLAPTTEIGTNRAEASEKRAQALNPMVNIIVNKTCVDDLPDEFYKGFDVVCATNCSQNQLIKINNICHSEGIKFFCGQVWGMFGYMFADLQEHEYAEDVIEYRAPKRFTDGKVSKVDCTVNTVKEKLSYTFLEKALNVDWSDVKYSSRLRRGDPSYFVTKVLLQFRNQTGRDPDPDHYEKDYDTLLSLRDSLMKESNVPVEFVPDSFFEYVFEEVSPACAIVGGVLGQEIIKAVSQKESPHDNMFFFNPMKCLGVIERYGY